MVKKGKKVDATIAPNETYLLTKNVIKNKTALNPAAGKLIANTIPSKVATPFPPENLRNIDQLWPITTVMPQANTQTLPIWRPTW